MSHIRCKAAASIVLLAVVLSACTQGLDRADPTLSEALPAPGSIHLISDPPQAPYPVTIRYLNGGDASGAYHDFAQGETILIVFSNLPGERGIQVNGRACEGRYTLETGVETDLLLVLGDEGCRVEVTGSHREGSVHSNAPTDPEVD
jgi:hypothetical protein